MTEIKKIEKVLRKHHLMTLATGTVRSGSEGPVAVPWVAHVFYVWAEELGAFVFTSDPETRHGAEMTAGPVAGGIGLETKNVGRVQGVQITGRVRRPKAAGEAGAGGSGLASGGVRDEAAAAKLAYLRKFPYAAAMGELSVWLMEPDYMKLTDNTLGFGTKIVWEK